MSREMGQNNTLVDYSNYLVKYCISAKWVYLFPLNTTLVFILLSTVVIFVEMQFRYKTSTCELPVNELLRKAALNYMNEQ